MVIVKKKKKRFLDALWLGKKHTFVRTFFVCLFVPACAFGLPVSETLSLRYMRKRKPREVSLSLLWVPKFLAILPFSIFQRLSMFVLSIILRVA